MKTIYLTKGHQVINGKGTGAHSLFGDEAVEAEKVVNALIKRLAQENINVRTDENKWSLIDTIGWLLRNVKANDLSIDFHFNASVNPKATGCEVLIPSEHTLIEKTLAGIFAKEISYVLMIKNRGVKTEAESQHKTLGILRRPKIANNLLIEVCFITNEQDMLEYKERFLNLIESLSRVIVEYFKK